MRVDLKQIRCNLNDSGESYYIYTTYEKKQFIKLIQVTRFKATVVNI